MRRSVRAVAISAIVILTTQSSHAVQRGPSAGVKPPPAKVTAAKTVSTTTVKTGKKSNKAPLSPVQRKLQRNPGLAAKIGGRLPAGANLMTAASGFRTMGEFVSAVNGSHSARIPFAELKRRMAYDGMTLTQAIQDLRPKSDYRSQAQRAEAEAAALIGTDEVEGSPTVRLYRTPQ